MQLSLEWFQGDHLPGKLEKSGNLELVREKEFRKSPENCGLPVVCSSVSIRHKININ